MKPTTRPCRHIARRHAGCLWLLALTLMFPWVSRPARAVAQPLGDDALLEIATEAYYYAYPMVIMDVTRQISTNGERSDPQTLTAPTNQFVHLPEFPDATFTDVVRPNADTLYSNLWFDVSEEPLVIDVPDSAGRYYLLPMLDMWSDVFASPGKRTTGTAAQRLALVGPAWRGELPAGVEEIRAPTAMGWIIGRTQANGPADFPAVRRFQAQLKAYPLSAIGQAYAAPKGTFDSSVSKEPPNKQVANMSAAEFFHRFSLLTQKNPPHPHDYPILARMRRLGLTPGTRFDFASAPPRVQAALKRATALGKKSLTAGLASAGTKVNGWSMLFNPIGTYGTDYYRRALIAYGGLGANVVEDAVYPTAFADSAGEPFDSTRRYVVRFRKDQLPPVRAFWSLTMYNDRQAFADNPLNRYALGDRDNLKFAQDGSLTLYIQRESPGEALESNWLPTPTAGGFSMNLRLYWPKPEVIEGSWKPPAVEPQP